MKTLILVTGATGTIGRDVVKLLAENGASVRAGVRDPSKAKGKFGEEVELSAFDFDDAASFDRALKGAGAVFLLPPVMENQVEVSRAFVDAAVRAGVRRIVKLSVIEAEAELPYAFGQWHVAVEQHIRASGISFTFLRPNSFMQNFITYFPPRGGVIAMPWGAGKASFVDTRDIAAVAAAALVSDDHAGKTYTLTGPAALSVDDVAQTLSDAAGTKITYLDAPESAARDGMLQAGLPKWQVDALMELNAINKQGRWVAATSDVEEVTGKPPRDFSQFARDHAEKFRQF